MAREKAYITNRNGKVTCLVKMLWIVVIFNFFHLSYSRKLSLKESLTAYAEASEEDTQNERISRNLIESDSFTTPTPSAKVDVEIKRTTSNNISTPLEDHGQDQPRSKKEISNLLWNTATALWAANKVHFLPTFLHTKTGGKLSLIRDSIFKPVTILSQFTNGIQEINNEKLNSLARLASGRGWSSPPNSEIIVVKVPPENQRLWTFARYFFRLTKHTVITKWRLRRALLDLQVRALRRLWRIISSKNVPQKVAKMKILTNAIIQGKLSLSNIFAGSGNNGGPYHGKDNSLDVDITIAPSNHEQNYWADNHQYQPPPPEYVPLEQSSPTAPTPKKINYYRYETPILGESSPSASVALPPTLETILDRPLFASILETMGIRPPSNDYRGDNKRRTEEVPSSKISPIASSPHVTPKTNVAYPISNLNTAATTHPKSIPFFESSLQENPSASYSFHFDSDDSGNEISAAYQAATSSLRSYLSSVDNSYSSYGSKPPEMHITEKSVVPVPQTEPTSTTEKSIIPQTESTSTTEKSVKIQAKPSIFRFKLLDAMLKGLGH